MVLIGAAPVFAANAGWLEPQLITLVTAIMLALLPGAPEADVRRSTVIFRPLVATALIPAARMLLQIVPVPGDSIAHPIWRSSSAALSAPVAGHISIDLGLTLRAFFEYLSLIALAFSTSVLARNRERAETILFALCTITVFTALELLLFKTSAEKGVAGSQDTSDNLVALASFGAILNAAFIVRTVERYDACPA
jgi:hypothetical protein